MIYENVNKFQTRKSTLPARNAADPQIDRTRRLIFRTFVSVLALLIGGGLLYSMGAFDSIIAGADEYAIIANTQPPTATSPITVKEFFSYGCPHCSDFDPQVASWHKSLPADVRFERSPVSFGNPQYDLYARTYFSLLGLGALEQNHVRLFTAIHQRGQNFIDRAAIAAFVDGHGASEAVMRRAMGSPRVAARLESAMRDEQNFRVQEIPALVVSGHYRIDVGKVGRAQALHIANRLIEAIRAGKPPGAAGSAHKAAAKGGS